MSKLDPMVIPLESLDIPELLDLQHTLGDMRADVLDRQHVVQAELDARAAAMGERRREEAALLGQVDRPPTQSVLGEAAGTG